MAIKRCLLLKAKEYNWGLLGPGDWSEVEWQVYYDGSFEVISTFNPSFVACKEMLKKDDRPKLVRTKTTGKMNKKTFSKLQEAIKNEPWRDPSLNVSGCDGVAWEIESYSENGSIKHTSGKPDYIYGHRVLETIVSLLPKEGNLYETS